MTHTLVIIHDSNPLAVATITTAVDDQPVSVHRIAVEDTGDVHAIIEALMVEYGLNANERAQVWLDDQGYARKQIAARLGLSPGSVTVYWRYVYDKLGVSDRPALRAWLKQLRRELESKAEHHRTDGP